jgi:ADP-ribose pyrophosphatase YjhB (NUDIX family)
VKLLGVMNGVTSMDWIEAIKEYNPYNDQEKKDKEIILQCISTFRDLLTRNNELVHVTSSAFIINKTKDKALMIHHNIYNSWSWTGGHADGNKDLLSVALSEASEETGIKNVHPIGNGIVSLDILPVQGHIKKGLYVAPHLHLSVAYLAEADEADVLTVKEDENSAVEWIPIDDINRYSSEPHMQKVYSKIISKIRN